MLHNKLLRPGCPAPVPYVLRLQGPCRALSWLLSGTWRFVRDPGWMLKIEYIFRPVEKLKGVRMQNW